MLIKDHSLFKEVHLMASQTGYELIVKTKDLSRGNVKGLGFHEVNVAEKTLTVSVVPELDQDIGIWVHELLHAKLFLSGYPKIYTYPGVTHQPNVEYLLLEVENIAQHTQIYKMMNELGVSQQSHNERYIDDIEGENEKDFSGPMAIIRALRLLEGYYRNPIRVISFEDKVKASQPKAYSLYRKMKKNLVDTSTPTKMRRAISENIDLANSFFKSALNADFHLKVFVRLDPILSDVQKKKCAAEVFRAVKYDQYSDVFLFGRDDQHCCLFLRGLSIDQINLMLNQLEADDFLFALKNPSRR